MSHDIALAVRFPEFDLGEASQLAQSLREELLDEVAGASAEIRKDDPTNQDFGATLVLMLGTPAIVALATGIATWIRRNRKGCEIEVDGSKVSVRIDGTVEDNAVRIVQALSGHK